MSRQMIVQPLRRPCSPTVLHILLALVDGPRHGYAIKQQAESGSNGAVRLGPGTLYEAIQRLLDAQLVRETDGSDPANGQEAQRRYYELTARGRRLLREEIAQLGRLVEYANGKLPADPADAARPGPRVLPPRANTARRGPRVPPRVEPA